MVAILSADVVGYSGLMALDETGTLSRLKTLRREFIEPLIEGYHGRVVKLMGDGALVEFASVVDAVACGVEIQRIVARQNLELPKDIRIVFRIGINLGDVIIDGDDFYGNGVNIAARLQGLSDPGGIAISGTAYDQAHDKLGLTFKSLGERHLKNIPEPVRVYRVLLKQTPITSKSRSRRWSVFGAAVLFLALTAVVALTVWPQAIAFLRGDVHGAVDSAAGRPSIAVLPFGDLSDDPAQDYFAEGLTDDLITNLSKISGLLVIARNSSFSFKDRSLDITEIAEQLNVHYVVEGSVRREGDAVRINVQLIDGKTGSNIWAERYDRDYSKLFALQDEVIGRIVEALSVRLTAGEKTQIARLPTQNLEAYDFYIRAEQKVYAIDYKSLGEALSLYQNAIKLDPAFADAYSGYARATVDVLGFDFQRLMLSAVARQRAYEAAGRALVLNPQSSRAYAVLGILQMLDSEWDEALASVQKAVTLDPNGAEAELNLAIVLTYAGQNPAALAAMERVLQLDPKPRAQVFDYYGFVLYMNRQYEKALQALSQVQAEERSDLGLETLAMANARLGRMAEAHNAVAAILKKIPVQNLAGFRVVYAHHRRQQDLDHRIDALRLAGLPERCFDFRGRDEDRLDASAIQALAGDRTWVGHQYNGAPFVMELSANGDFAMSSQNGIIAGAFTLEDNLFCTRSSATLLGRKFCGPVYRNPQGSSEKRDEYVLPDSVTVWYFSVSP
ncbi:MULTISPECIES: adenylate/guanylate cyclase domain-containing protein [unclassified Mesorhizobium]|uniref:adenylate/guanylate cyclase domain-containing protein n=1 Tax=unclassified Mesorhizobium TaxID=325217 RepID=UPI001FE0FA97|nr:MULTISPECIES: adenylate/guanylate cyclase domain-containing protein [unclassified Mesorhizobium]MCT2579685.1 guanylyl cyclase [Mesorhizobium sp. P13.3]MDF3168958.1 adenylate/guanylate cyclase domain-containing protein [Mesorhizobium sp. P16.1]MDF3178494.1 adenylate/guanylate cyclase domain-containing protein [Mesorhizobium sp. P17.1]MDF3185871.1 adenylate/guanylate cyclase domain-containing protein [Mesorhizobium sp. ICCV3110.1]